LRQALEQGRDGENPGALVNTIRADIARFVGDAEAADDLTLLVLRWNGPSAR
jgi:serine phosphatase RsbU (regulator of sigma subunit)